ncbi:MAG: OmpA family protein, partial [Bacteroidota bacterium]
GYFSSSREGGKGGDDIWSFVLPPLSFNLDGFVTDAADGKPVANAIVYVKGSDGTNFPLKTDQKGHYNTKLVPEASYEVKCETDANTKNSQGLNYLTNSDLGKFTTVGLEESKNFRKDFQLTVATSEIHFPEVLFDLNKWDLRPESKDSLNYLYKVLVDNPTIVIELSAHTDSRDATVYNDTLSNNRARSCYFYLVNEKKIKPARIKPKGYGERKLLITDAEINKAKSKEEKEALHQKNRRTVFKVLSWDYIDPDAPSKPPIVHPKVTGEENSEELPDTNPDDHDK